MKDDYSAGGDTSKIAYPPTILPVEGIVENTKPSLFKSRKFRIAVATLSVDVIVALVPALEPVQDALIEVITTVGAILIAAIAAEDFAFWFGAGKQG